MTSCVPCAVDALIIMLLVVGEKAPIITLLVVGEKAVICCFGLSLGVNGS